MDSESFKNVQVILDGQVHIYQRVDQLARRSSPNWQAYFKFPNRKGIRQSLGTPVYSKAKREAERRFYELDQKSQRGESLTSKRLSIVATAFLDDLLTKVERDSKKPPRDQQFKPKRYKNKKTIVEKYLLVFFKSKTLHEITDFDVEDYKSWRSSYWVTGAGSKVKKITFERKNRDGRVLKMSRPRNAAESRAPNYGTINKELTVLREIYDFAWKRKLIVGSEIPTIKNLRKPKNAKRKSGFTEEEHSRLLATTHKRYKAEKNPKHKRHLKLVLHYMSFMSLTGVRETERKNIRFRDCKIFDSGKHDYVTINVFGKGKSRTMVGLHGSATVVKKLITYHDENAQIMGWGRSVSDDDLLFLDQYGNPVGSFSGSVKRAFTDAGDDIICDGNGVKRNIGAFRKYYITLALKGGVQHSKLARNCGTSSAVIDKIYSELSAHHTPEEFTLGNCLAEIYEEEAIRENAGSVDDDHFDATLDLADATDEDREQSKKLLEMAKLLGVDPERLPKLIALAQESNR